MLLDCVRTCCAKLREDAGLVSVETLLAFGVIAPQQLDFFRQTSLIRWLMGGELPPLPPQGNLSYEETILDVRGLDLGACLTGAEMEAVVGALQHPVWFTLSRPTLAHVARWLETEEDEVDAAAALRTLSDGIGAQLAAPETRPQGAQVNMEELGALGALGYLQRWQLYR